MIETARGAIQTAKKTGGQNWTQLFQQRQTAKRIAEKLKKKQAEQANLTTRLNAAAASALIAA